MIRPSNLDRRAACPGSERMEEGLPDEDTLEAQEGITLHSFQAHPEYDRSFLKPNQQELLKIAGDLDQKLFDTVIQNEKLLDSDEIVEQHEIETVWWILRGHIDLIRTYPSRSVTIIRDSKFGYIPVERAEMNLQLRGYAAMSEEGVVYVAITQPRAPFDQRITVARYTHQDVLDARQQIEEIIRRSSEKDAPLHAGDWCRYCRARAICPELAKAVKGGLMPVETIADVERSKAAKLARAELTLSKISDQDLSKMLQAYSLVQFIYDPMMAEARRRIRNGKMVDWKLSKAQERRKIVNAQKAISLLALAGMSREDIMECASLSLTKLEDKLNHGTLRQGDVITGAKDAKDFTNRVLSSVIETEVGLPRILKK